MYRVMYYKPPSCPKCLQNQEYWDLAKAQLPKFKGNWFKKKGYFKTKHNGQKVPRYQCKVCDKFFSSRTHLPTYKQKKPALNQTIFKLYCSGLSLRRMALIMGINRKTVYRKFLYLARESRNIHEEFLRTTKMYTSHVQFDEIETFEHTSLKPLSVSIAVRSKTGEILEARVAEMINKGPATSLATRRYGYRVDQRLAAFEDVFRVLNSIMIPNGTIVTDASPSYVKPMQEFACALKHTRVSSAERINGPKNRRNKNDVLWRLNHIAAKLRNDLSRLSRKTWTTTKRMWALQAHIDLYIAFNNKYKIV